MDTDELPDFSIQIYCLSPFDQGKAPKLYAGTSADGTIYESVDATPSHQKDLIEANAIYRNGDPDLMAQAEAIVAAHVAARPDIMAVPAAERAAAHPNFS